MTPLIQHTQERANVIGAVEFQAPGDTAAVDNHSSKRIIFQNIMLSKEVAMFTKVHHVTYVVESIDQMAEYMEKNFGLKPARTDEIGDRGYKSILYHIGPTMVDFFEPTQDDTAMARQLKEQGPGVAHVAWGVDGIDQAFRDLRGKGNEIRGDGPSTSPFGYKTLTIDTSSAHGIYFQLAEGEVV